MVIMDSQENSNDNAFQALPSESLCYVFKYLVPIGLRVS